MYSYEVRITETLSRVVVVYADDKYDAEKKVQDEYEDEQIVLDYHDFADCDIEVLNGEED